MILQQDRYIILLTIWFEKNDEGNWNIIKVLIPYLTIQDMIRKLKEINSNTGAIHVSCLITNN